MTNSSNLNTRNYIFINKEEHGLLNVEKSGGLILRTWLDRPLGLAGKVVLRSEDVFKPDTQLVNFDRPLLTIPSLAIHMDREVNKEGKLTDEEFDLIKSHPIIGSDMLKDITIKPHLYYGARWHHERYDGRGYPDGLKGEEIPIEARIISVADAYDAMTSVRRYRKELPPEKVRQELIDGRGTQFDPKIVGVMLELIAERKRVGHPRKGEW